MKKSLAILFIFTVTLLSFTACQQQAIQNTNQPIKVGAILPLTGNASYIGEVEQIGMQIAQDEINQSGGINGRQIKIIFEDSQLDPKTGATTAHKLIDKDQVKIIISTTGPISRVTAPIADQNKILMFADTVDDGAAALSPNIFRLLMGESVSANIMGKMTVDQNFTNIAILSVNTDWAKGAVESFKQPLKNSVSIVVFEEYFQRTQTNFTTQLTKIKEKNAQLIFYLDYAGPSSINFYKQKNELGLNDIQVYGDISGGYYTYEKLPANERHIMEGTISMFFPSIYQLNTNNPKITKFVSKHKTEYGDSIKDPLLHNAYEHIQLIKSIIEQCGHENNTECLIQKLHTTKYVGLIGPVQFDQSGNSLTPAKFAQLKNGQWREIFPD